MRTPDETPSAAFNADALARASEPPALILGGRRFVGRLLSIEEWLAFVERMRTLEGADVAALLAFYASYLRATFPPGDWPVRRLLRRDPVALLLRQPFGVIQQAFDAFFSHQAYAMGVRPLRMVAPTSPPTTPGTASPGRTQAPPAVARESVPSDSEGAEA